jgi:hypothetical protein
VVALLLAAFEPGLVFDLPKLGRIFHGRQLQALSSKGLPPGRTQAVASQPSPVDNNPELQAAFGAAYDSLRRPAEEVGLGDVLIAAWKNRNDGLFALLERNEQIPAERLKQIQTAMRQMLLSDMSDRVDGETGAYGAAARRLIQESHGSIDVVIMGHSHLPRHIGPAERASYINTGTWADVIRVPRRALDEDGARDMHDFLVKLKQDRCRSTPATYADVHIDADGAVVSAVLATADPP